jgi:zinc transporter, ZIP family
MLDAFGLGVLAQSSLLLAGLLAYWVTVPTRLVGILAGFGAGAMISAIPRQPSTLPNGRRSCGC